MSIKKALKLNNAGVTILESLLGLALIGIVMSSFVGGIVSMNKVRGEADGSRILNKQINDIIEGIRPNLKLYQLSYDSSKNSSERLDLKNLPMAWGNGVQAKASECKDCPGRYGYMIQSYDGYYGLYLVTVRFSHKEWSTKKNPTISEYGFVDYEFVVNVQ